jgi:hypothetical protein
LPNHAYDGRGFVGPKTKTILDPFVFNKSLSCKLLAEQAESILTGIDRQDRVHRQSCRELTGRN